MRGYLKHRLSGAENSALDEALEWYRLGLVPLRTPLDLLRGYFESYPDAYIGQQVYMQPRLHARFDPSLLFNQSLLSDPSLLSDQLHAGAPLHSAGER